MARVYTRRLAIAEFGDTGVYHTLYVVPAAPTTVVLRDIMLTNSSALEGYVYLTVSAPLRLPPATLFIWHSIGPATIHAELRQELLPGERLVITSSVQPYSVALTGYIFDS